MNDEDHTLNHWEFLGEKGVEDDAECGDGDDEEGSLPALWNVVDIVEDEQALNHGSHQEGERCEACLPS